jgi:hypothetical protein
MRSSPVFRLLATALSFSLDMHDTQDGVIEAEDHVPQDQAEAYRSESEVSALDPSL